MKVLNTTPVGTQSPTLLDPTVLAREILLDVMRFRRMSSTHANCADKPCEACQAPHLPRIAAAIAHGKPITFVLPAFPGKSPNPAKVLGHLPDMAEECALKFLGQVCKNIEQYYSPGARIILCSDGRVFSDSVGMPEQHVTEYQQEIAYMIERLGLTSMISLFNLDDLYEIVDFDLMRRELMEQYGKPLDVLRDLVRQGGKEDSSPESEEAHRLYCGITRFLVEDATRPGETETRSAIQKKCRVRAYEVIQRSNAWSELLAVHFPDAVRLSIHPQTCGTKKLGIRLMDAQSWMTPWHGVAVDMGGRFELLKRSQAEAMCARVVEVAGRPSHYELMS